MHEPLRARFDRAGRPAARLARARAWLAANEFETTSAPAMKAATAIAELSDKDAAVAILEQLLEPLSTWYTHVDVEEIVMNRPGELWIRNRRPRDGKIWEPIEAPHLTYDLVGRIVRVVANVYEVPFGEDSVPVVYTRLPGGHRFTAGMGQIVDYDGSSARGSLVLAIRQAPRNDIAKVDYESYGLKAGEMVEPVFHVSEETAQAFGSIGVLQDAMRQETHILISGGTSSGKTTLLDRMIEDLPLSRRVATVEDTRELQLKHPNRFHVILPRTESIRLFDENSAKDLLTRMTPDVIIAGELSSRNASLIYNLTGTGHGAMMTTIHAESPDIAVERFIELIQNQRGGINEDKLAKSLREKFLIVQLSRDHAGRRRVTEIREPERA